MYAPLRDLSPELSFAGRRDCSGRNHRGCLVNHPFIKTHMAGLKSRDGAAFAVQWLSHGSARQLLPRVLGRRRVRSSAVRPRRSGGARRSALKDIPLEHIWDQGLPLGGHPERARISLPNNVVLLICGELLRRYPTAIISAGKAKKEPDGTRELQRLRRNVYPIFRRHATDPYTFLPIRPRGCRHDARGGTQTSPKGCSSSFRSSRLFEPRFGLEPTEAGATTTN